MTTINAEIIWGAAVAAQRINGEYLKEDQFDYNTTPSALLRRCNKGMVRDAVAKNEFNFVTEADIEQGREVRQHFNGYVFLQIAGKANDFQQMAFKIAQMSEFTKRNALELSVLSSLPSVATRDNIRKDLESRMRDSQPLTGEEGSKVTGIIVVESSRYSQFIGKYSITARLNDSYVDFWYGEQLQPGSVKNLRGKIKQHRGNGATQLNYVKLSVDTPSR